MKKTGLEGMTVLALIFQIYLNPKGNTSLSLFPASVFKCSLNFQVHIITDNEPKRLKC